MDLEIQWLSGKEKVQGTAVSKKIILTVFWDMKGPITIDFLEKVQMWTVLPIANSLGKIHLIYWIILVSVSFSHMCVYIYIYIYIYTHTINTWLAKSWTEYTVSSADGDSSWKMGVLGMTVNYLMGRLQVWSSGKCIVLFYCHYSQAHSDPEW